MSADQNPKRVGISRRQFHKLMGITGAAAITGIKPLASAYAQEIPVAPEIFVKSPEGFMRVFSTELGTPWYNTSTWITPIEEFYVRSRYATPIVDPATWTLRITGDAIERELELTYDELLALPRRRAIRYMECFGNGRTINREQLGYQVQGGNWGFSAISQGEWEYVPISEILNRVGVKPEAVQVLFWSGVDGPDTGRPMPIEAVLERAEDIGLAFRLNGKPLHPDHGGPVRAHVPGWGGAASIKWLTEIRIASHRFWTRMHTREEALMGEDYPVEEFSETEDEFIGAVPADIQGQTATWLNVKSHLDIPLVLRNSEVVEGYPLAEGEVPVISAGSHVITGRAYSPHGIERVDYSLDEGLTWQEATLEYPGAGQRYMATRFSLNWDATSGTHFIMTRATDMQGNVQPETVPLNLLGILCNAIPRFEINVQ